MYHFTADHPPEPVRLSFRALIPGHIRQYLKDFQLDAIRFMHNFLAKTEFCVYNDESGLGKQAAVCVLLDAACSSRKCLIVVQNDDRYVDGWQFHIDVLTNVNAMVIKDEKDSIDSAHNIYISKWSSLRTIDDLSKYKFDFIILDNRGQMLNNNFCTSMLLKHYERKINILISSVDITSDLKLLHNVLRLGGRLEPQYSSFKTFEEKFKLPDAKSMAYKRVDLEEYFCKRERLADYCRTFRLRRYCHQFEGHLPLVREDRYKINLDLWREKQNTTNSEGSSIEFVGKQNRMDEQIKDTQELFEEYCRQRRKEHLQFQQEEEQRLMQREQDMLKGLQTEKEIIYNVDDEVALINETLSTTRDRSPISRDSSDEMILMSPLLVESDSDADDVPEMCINAQDNIEFVDLSSEEKQEAEQKNKQIQQNNEINFKSQSCAIKKGSKWKKRTELDRLAEDIVSTLKVTEKPKRLTRHAKEEDVLKSSAKRLKDRLEEKKIEKANLQKTNKQRTVKSMQSNLDSTPSKANNSIRTEKLNNQQSVENSQISSNNKQISPKKTLKTPPNVNTLTEKENSRATRSANSKLHTNSMIKQSRETNNTSQIATPVTSRRTRTIKNEENENHKQIKQEILEETPQFKKLISKEAKVNSERIRLKRELEITPVGVHHKQMRSMQRLTRSAGGSNKYLKKNFSLQIDKINKSKKKVVVKNVLQKVSINKTKTAVEEETKKANKNTQDSIISQRSSQDYDSLQCAQRLSDAAVFDNGLEKFTEFLVPPTPNATERNSLIPLSLSSSTGFLNESDIIFIPPTNPISTSAITKKREAVILISSSDNDSSTSQSSSTNMSTISRRTRALKPKRKHQQNRSVTSKVPGFSDLLTQRNARSSAKSPDLFSNCSDLPQLPCTQSNINSEEPNTPFEGFKIFGSEVKQLQQHYALCKNNNTNKSFSGSKKSFREQRSCLDILEKMFEPSSKKAKQINNEQCSRSTPTLRTPTRRATAANKVKAQIAILPSHPIDAITEARHQQEQQKRKRSTNSSSTLHDDEIFEITNNGTFGSVMRLHSNGDISPVQHIQKNNAKHHNKITNYLIGNNTQNVCVSFHDELNILNSGHSTGNALNNNNGEAGTPSKRHQQSAVAQNSNIKKSPKGKSNSTQTTKLTKWFTKPSDTINNQQKTGNKKSSHSKKTFTKQVQQEAIEELDRTAKRTSPIPTTSKRILKRRRLDLSFNK